MDGEENTAIIGSDLLKVPNGLALDFNTQTLYFVDSGRDMVAKTRADGSDFTLLYNVSNITGSGQANPVFLDYHEGALYFSERRDDLMFKLRVTPGTVNHPVQLASPTREIGNIKVVDPEQRQPLVPSK
jgi:hypothetical protein